MRKLCYIILFSIFLLSIMITSKTVSARSWVELEPQEVLDRAEVIVTGKYDFTGEPKLGESSFIGYEFNVNNVYRGDISDQTIIVGIDQNDSGWAEGFQSEGGEFLLFLESSEEVEFLVPVDGPNGMVELSNGKVNAISEEKSEFYNDFLIAHSEKTTENDSNSQINISHVVLSVSVGILIGVAATSLSYRYKGKK